MVQKVLEGIKIADFTALAAGPIPTEMLAFHGAEVVHVESSTHLDPLRSTGPFRNRISGIELSMGYASYNLNKYGITLNLRHPKGLEIAKKLVAWSDIVVENMTPGVMVRLGLGYDELRKVKPDIIMLSTTNEGQTGPRANRFGYGIQLSALCGLTNITGWPDRDPVIPFGAYSDYVSAHIGAAFLLAALDHRRRTGKGQYLDLSQNEATIQLMAPLFLDYMVNKRVANRIGNRCPYAAPHGVYPCRGVDRWCAIAVFTDEEWDGFCYVTGNPEWTRDPKFTTLLGRIRNQDKLDKLIAKWTVNFTAEEIMIMMQSAGVAAGVVRTMDEINQDPQLNYRNQFREIEHPEIGRHGCDVPSYILSKTPAEVRMPAPLLGQHNEYVYTKLLGIPDEEFVKLLEEGVFD